MSGWPRVRKEGRYTIRAKHHLAGISIHTDADEPHWHDWEITLIWDNWEHNPDRGFARDEVYIDGAWGRRLQELDGADLNAVMPAPPTAENLACWLLFDWLPRLTPHEINHEVSAIRVSKCARFSCEVSRRESARWNECINQRLPRGA